MRYGNVTVSYYDTKGMPDLHNTAPLKNTPSSHSIPKQDGETTTKYSNDSTSQCDLAKLQEHFQQLQE